MKNRRLLLWGCLLVAVVLSVWGVARHLDARPNPILVKVGPSQVEVEVARARPIRMTISEMSNHGVPGSVTAYEPTADPDEVAVEVRELRRALDVWLAVPGRGMTVDQYWSDTEIHPGLLRGLERARVVLHARLVPVPAAEK